MKKSEYIKRGACIAAAVMMLGACGQAKEETAPETTAAVETTAEEPAAPENQDKENASDKETMETAEEEETAEKDGAEDKDASDENESDKETSDKDASDKEKNTDSENDASEDKSSEAQVNVSQAQETEKEPAAEETPTEVPAQAGAKSVQDIYGEIGQKVALNSPMILPDDFIMNYYGIDVSTLDEYVFSMSEAAISAETVVILKAKDAGSTSALSASLQTVIDQKRSEMENYLPEQFEIVDKSSVQVKGNYVYLVISENADAISQIIQADLQ